MEIKLDWVLEVDSDQETEFWGYANDMLSFKIRFYKKQATSKTRLFHLARSSGGSIIAVFRSLDAAKLHAESLLE